jgi:hypothetical protein
VVSPAPIEYANKRYSADRLAEAAVMAGFTGDDVAIAVAVALAESGGKAAAIGRNSNGSADYGPWQINSIHSHLITPSAQWWGLVPNAKMAHSVFAGRNNTWQPWTVYRTGAYLMFMPTAKAAAGKVPENVRPGGVSVDPGPDGVIEHNPISDMVGSVREIGAAIFKTGAWIADPDNWLRVAYVVAGGAMLIGALTIVARPYAMDAAKTAAAVRGGGKGKR